MPAVWFCLYVSLIAKRILAPNISILALSSIWLLITKKRSLRLLLTITNFEGNHLTIPRILYDRSVRTPWDLHVLMALRSFFVTSFSFYSIMNETVWGEASHGHACFRRWGN